WNGTSYSTPEETLLGNRHARIFLRAIPQITASSPRMDNVFRSLGISPSPQPLHWHNLFVWFAEKYQIDGGPISRSEVAALRTAYAKLDGLPSTIESNARCLLDDRAHLHTLDDLSAAKYVIDDDPDLREALDSAGVRMGFADTAAPDTRRFYSSLGIKHLSEL